MTKRELSSSAVYNREDGSVVISFDLRVYSISAVKKTAYNFAAAAAAVLTQSGENELEVQLWPGEIERDVLIQSFCRDVIDQDLREQVARETENVRNLILAHAFSKTSLLQE